jgi:hypothetical protein
MGPILFNGHSIIHEVLQQIDFPLKLSVPGFNPFVECAQLSIIDIVVPTFYISFISRFGRDQGTNSYYIAHIFAYAISLGIFTCVMVYTGMKQPALLFVVPTLLFFTFVTAGIRREWGSKLSLDSSLESDGYRPHGKKGNKDDQETTSARGMERFDLKKLTQDGQEFRKFEDEDGREEVKEEEKQETKD